MKLRLFLLVAINRCDIPINSFSYWYEMWGDKDLCYTDLPGKSGNSDFSICTWISYFPHHSHHCDNLGDKQLKEIELF